MVKFHSRLVRTSLLSLSLLLLGLDQITKYLIRQSFALYETVPFVKGWNWVLIYNKGSAFGFLANQGGWQQIIFGLVAVFVSGMLTHHIFCRPYHLLSGIAFSFVLGGALGNLTDRIFNKEVTDFIDWHFLGYHWPAFNLADVFITVGITLLILESIFVKSQKND